MNFREWAKLSYSHWTLTIGFEIDYSFLNKKKNDIFVFIFVCVGGQFNPTPPFPGQIGLLLARNISSKECHTRGVTDGKRMEIDGRQRNIASELTTW